VRLEVARKQTGFAGSGKDDEHKGNDMNEFFSVRAIASVFSAAVITATMMTGFYQSTSSQPTQWPVSINATQGMHRLA
jgi:hypothetical protein